MHKLRIRAMVLLGLVMLASGTWWSSGARAETATVTITDPQYNPRSAQVTAGSVVIWVNQGSLAHTVTSNDGIWDSGHIPVGSTFQWSFSQPGIYKYHCTVHPRITGEVVVAGAAVNPPTATSAPVVAPTSPPLPTSPASRTSPAQPPSSQPTRLAAVTVQASPIPTATPTPGPTQTPTPVPPVLLHLAHAAYAPQPPEKLRQVRAPALAATFRLLPEPAAQRIQLDGGRLVLEIAADAPFSLRNALVSAVQPMPAGLPSGLIFADARVFQLASADGSSLSFSRPVLVEVTYDLNLIGGAPEKSLALAAWDVNPARWQALPSTVDTRRHLVRSQVDRLTALAIVGRPGS